ncbi:MAG: hypothetical protein Q4G35_01630 [Propionibacteriaceae bacterium]|nr:hypothetical protein [Propionibacteriaceae bacterium]
MIDVVEWVTGRIYALRITSWQQWLLRGMVVAAGVAAGWLASAWVAPMILTLWWVLTVAAVLAAAVRPDSLAPLLAVTPVALAWLGGGADAQWWRHIAVVACVALFHLAAAFAAAAPTFSGIRGRVARRMLLAGVAFLLLSVLVALPLAT